MTTIEVLKAARKRIEKPENWTQGAIARDSDGQPIESGSLEDAACWCAVGALDVVCDDMLAEHLAATGALYDVLDALGSPSIGGFNDTHTHAEVLAAFDKAIANEEAKTS